MPREDYNRFQEACKTELNENYFLQNLSTKNLKTKYMPATKIEFEGKMYNAPNDYDYVLTKVYDDYMTFPPEDERVPSHYKDLKNIMAAILKKQYKIGFTTGAFDLFHIGHEKTKCGYLIVGVYSNELIAKYIK